MILKNDDDDGGGIIPMVLWSQIGQFPKDQQIQVLLYV